MGRPVLVLGGGFGGLQAAIELERLLPEDDEILVISEQNFLLFTPLLPQIASSRINPRHIVQTIRDIRGKRRFGFRRDSVTEIDVNARSVILGWESIDYDALVIALGARTGYFGISGASKYTRDFKTLEDAVLLRDHVLDMCEHADHIADETSRRDLLRFVVVGGGYTGVELITELACLECGAPVQACGFEKAVAGGDGLDAGNRFSARRFDSAATHAVQDLRRHGAARLASASGQIAAVR